MLLTIPEEVGFADGTTLGRDVFADEGFTEGKLDSTADGVAVVGVMEGEIVDKAVGFELD